MYIILAQSILSIIDIHSFACLFDRNKLCYINMLLLLLVCVCVCVYSDVTLFGYWDTEWGEQGRFGQQWDACTTLLWTVQLDHTLHSGGEVRDQHHCQPHHLHYWRIVLITTWCDWLRYAKWGYQLMALHELIGVNWQQCPLTQDQKQRLKGKTLMESWVIVPSAAMTVSIRIIPLWSFALNQSIAALHCFLPKWLWSKMSMMSIMTKKPLPRATPAKGRNNLWLTLINGHMESSLEWTIRCSLISHTHCNPIWL